MNEDAFLSALRENPGDEVTWLALADWLDEAGQEPRAELLRLVRQLRSVSVMRRTRKRVALERRVAELLLAGVRPVVPEFINSLGMRLALIPAGRCRMGSPLDEPERSNDELLHQVEITRPFYLGVFSVTQAQYQAVMGENNSHSRPDRAPALGMDTSDFAAEMISWQDAIDFCQRLTRLENRPYRLPTEAEWEYACRGGSASTTAFYLGDALSADLANFDGAQPYNGAPARPGLGCACPGGRYPPNVFGLYDMHGNVFDWCADWAGDYPTGTVRDPTGPDEGTSRSIRGGGWACPGKYCRAANRGQNDERYRGYQNGVRVALSMGAVLS